MRKHREQRALRLRRETLRTLSDRGLARVAGGSWGGVGGDEPMSETCWSDSETMGTGTRFC